MVRAKKLNHLLTLLQELQPATPWKGDYDAVNEGPICIQDLNIYGDLLQPQFGMSEACIYANIHVPIHALPENCDDHEDQGKGLPIVVVIHGGGFNVGSGDTDLHGPEYLVSKNVIVMSFNYRQVFSDSDNLLKTLFKKESHIYVLGYFKCDSVI
jgi:carboxylesterase type B